MNEETSKARLILADRPGMLTNLVTQAADLAEKAVLTNFNVIRDVRGEVHGLVTGTLEWVEGSHQRAFNLARGLHDRIGKLTEDALQATESVTLSLVDAFRETGLGVTDVAHRATGAFLKNHDEKVAQAA